MSFLVIALTLVGTALSTAYAVALAALELPSKLPSPLSQIAFIALIIGAWGTIYEIFGLVGIELNFFGVPLDGYSVAMVVVTGWVVSHFLFK